MSTKRKAGDIETKDTSPKSKTIKQDSSSKGAFEPVPEHILHLLNHNFELLDEDISKYFKLVSDLGAHQCWHKHGTFGEHLINVWKIFQVWKLPQAVCRMGLFHSTYSNSWVGLALFKPNTERHKLREIVGKDCEELVHVMCSVPRLSLTFRDCLEQFENKDIPEEGIVVKDIHTGGDLKLDRRMICIYLVFHVADWLEQFFGWQDKLFGVDGDESGDMALPFQKMLDGKFVENAGTLWPGDNRPGLYLSVLTRICTIIKTCGYSDLLPPVFNYGTGVLSSTDEKKARDLYWKTITTLTEQKDSEEAKRCLTEAIKLNPYIAEPHVLLAQIHLREDKYDEGVDEARQALKLLYAMGTNWDKRVSWEAWINWCRCMIRLGLRKEWPKTSMGIINLGLVEDK